MAHGVSTFEKMLRRMFRSITWFALGVVAVYASAGAELFQNERDLPIIVGVVWLVILIAVSVPIGSRIRDTER